MYQGITTEIVLSPVKDDKIKSNLNGSPIWKKAYKPEEVTEEVRAKHSAWFEYTIKFEGTKPMQVTKVKAV